MQVSSFYPVIQVMDVSNSAAAFYSRWFGFRPTFESDWYVSLIGPAGNELAVLDSRHETIPRGHGHPVRGVLLNLEVDDVDAEWQRLVVAGGLTAVLELRTEAFGQRHFIVEAPEGVLVDVITVIPAGAEYVDHYA
jgi:catechol 2,3-dioxygenase-like lactoylglutathione lyase family enzyme